MYKVYIERIEAVYLDGENELRKSIEFCFVDTPVIVIFPVVYESFYFGDWSAVYCNCQSGRCGGGYLPSLRFRIDRGIGHSRVFVL
jgi:hypothetical protein